MRARRRPVLLFLVGLLLSAADAGAGGLREFEDGWLTSPERCRLFLDPEGSRRGGWLAAGRSRLYGMPELPMSRLAAGWHGTRRQIEASWQRLGGTLYQEDRWRLSIGAGDRRRCGVTVGSDRLQVAGCRPAAQTALGLTLRLALGAGVVADLRTWLTPPPQWHARRGLRRLLTVGARRRRLLWTLAVERSEEDGPTVQGEVLVRPAVGCAFGLRVEVATATVVLVSCWTRQRCLLRTSHSVHPRLGVTHRWSLGWRFGGGGR